MIEGRLLGPGKWKKKNGWKRIEKNVGEEGDGGGEGVVGFIAMWEGFIKKRDEMVEVIEL